jgi:hypothetical protein
LKVTITTSSAPPTAADDNYTILEDSVMRFAVLTNDLAGTGSLAVAGIATFPLYGKVSINPDNTISYLPTADNRTRDSFYYKIVNSSNLFAVGKVVVNFIADSCSPGQYIRCIRGPNPWPVLAVEDTYLNDRNRDDNNTNNFGSEQFIVVDREATDKNRSLIRFNLPSLTCDTSLIPVITGATLKLYKSGGGGGSLPVDVYRATATWNQNQASWNNRLTATGWTTRGGDFDPALQATTTVNADGLYTWNLSSLVNNWYINPGTHPNQGILLKTTEGGGNRDPNFVSLENTSSLPKPTLEISYIIPNLCKTIPVRAPMAMPDSIYTNSLTPVTVNVLNNDFFPVSGTLSVSLIAGSEQNATATLSGNTILITPSPFFSGTASLLYRVVNNSTGLADTAKVFCFVSYAPPLANNDSATIASGQSVTVNVVLNDIDPQNSALFASVIGAPKVGLFTTSGNNITYTAPFNFFGRDTIVYRVTNSASGFCNEQSASDTGLFIIIVTNRAALAENDTVTTNPCTAIVVDVLNNDTDPEQGSLQIASISSVSPAAAGTATTDGSFLYFTPNSAFTGTVATLTYTTADDAVPPAISNSATVRINFSSSPNSAPAALPDSVSGVFNSSTFINVLNNDSDPEGDALTVSLGSGLLQPLHGTISVISNGLIQYTPQTGFTGTDFFEYRLTDAGVGLSAGNCTGQNQSSIARVKVVITSFFVLLEKVTLNVTGSLSSGHTQLNWLYESDKSPKLFVIEESADNRLFKPAGVVYPYLNNTAQQRYSWRESTPLASVMYYRIRADHSDGSSSYSNIITLKSAGTIRLSQAYPVPFNDQFTARIEATESGVVEVRLLNSLGQQVHVRRIAIRTGSNLIDFTKMESLPAGQYLLLLRQQETTLTMKLLKAK